MTRLLALFIFLLVPLLAADDQSARKAQIQSLLDASFLHGVTATGSMKPTFDEHYLLMSLSPREYPWALVKANDVVLAWETIDGQLILVCHRVLAKSSGGTVAVLLGDNNTHTDSQLLVESNYAGLVVGWVRCDVEAPKLGPPPRFVLDAGQTK